MTKRDFFRLVIKLFGLYTIVRSLLVVLPSSLTILFNGSNFIGSLAWFIGVIAAAIGLYVLLILKADTIINWLKLDKGFDDNNMNISNLNITKLLTLGLIIIGGLLIINSLISLVTNVTTIVSTRMQYFDGNTGISSFTQNRSYISVIGNILSIIIGYFLLVKATYLGQRFGNDIDKK